MKKIKKIIATFILLFIAGTGLAQPFNLDEKIKPVKLELQDDKKYEGAKGITANATIEADSTHYYYVVGHDLFQFVDVYIFSNYGNPKLEATLVKDSWKDVHETQNTLSADEGIIDFKLRTYGDFGFRITSADNEPVNYTIVVYATEPVMEYLDSPFVKANDENLGKTGSGGAGGSSNMLLYIALGVALLIIGFLGAKVLGRKKTTNLLLVLLLFAPLSGFAQFQGGGFWDPESTRNGTYESWLRSESSRTLRESSMGRLSDGLKRLRDVSGSMKGKLDDVLKKYKAIKELYEAYTGLGDCISSVPLPGAPSLPTFCETAACGSCFVDARKRLLEVRYYFEKLKTIYTCTKRFTDGAIALGDNVSGVHGVSGLAWQSERIKIQKSVTDMQKAYDSKYIDLLEDLQASLVDLNECEAQYGIPDWYDRFGYLYYDFIKFHYARAN